MSDMKASVVPTKNGFHVEGYEKIEYDFTFLDGVFDKRNANLADLYQKWGRCLAVMDLNIFNVYGDQMQEYFDHHKLELKIHKTMIGEKAKSMDTLLSIVDSMTEFGIIRKVSGRGRPATDSPGEDGADGATGARSGSWRWTGH